MMPTPRPTAYATLAENVEDLTIARDDVRREIDSLSDQLDVLADVIADRAQLLARLNAGLTAARVALAAAECDA